MTTSKEIKFAAFKANQKVEAKAVNLKSNRLNLAFGGFYGSYPPRKI